jgi:hypothetical protein
MSAAVMPQAFPDAWGAAKQCQRDAAKIAARERGHSMKSGENHGLAIRPDIQRFGRGRSLLRMRHSPEIAKRDSAQIIRTAELSLKKTARRRRCSDQ